ncbi:MAG TPA: TAXI family TRAP transporter solute-binding subunit [Clostridia bacterium]|nr:TAXI family TRAP transporter solute-binding subunit [Clostridia bacterium]
MIRNRKLFALISMVIISAFVLMSCTTGVNTGVEETSKVEESPKAEVQKISLAAASPGGALYVIGSGIAKILNDEASIDTSVESTGGAQHNQQLLNANEATVGLLTTNVALDAWNGSANWTGGKQLRDVRSIMPMFATIAQVMARKDSGITKFSDLNGKIVSLGPAGSAHDVEFRKIFEYLNVKPSKLLNLPLNDTMDQIRDHKVDAVLMISTAPNSTMSDFSTTMDAILVGFSDEEVKILLDKLPYMSAYELKAGMYKGLDTSLKTINQWCFLGASKDQPEELVYQITKTIIENWDYLETASSSTKGVVPQDIEFINLPLHKGAAKYMNEIGVKIPDKLLPPEK